MSKASYTVTRSCDAQMTAVAYTTFNQIASSESRETVEATMLANAEYQVNHTRAIWGSMMNQFVGTLDLTGAEIEYAGHRMSVTTGKLGHFDPNTREVRGRLSILSPVRPSILNNNVRIRWQCHEFEVMMMSVQDINDNGELNLKFIARWIPPVRA